MTAGEIGDLQPRCHQTAKINRRGDMTIGKIGIIRGACKMAWDNQDNHYEVGDRGNGCTFIFAVGIGSFGIQV